MANHASHAALPYPIKGARFTVIVPLLDADGDPTAQTTPDTELSKDNGAAADAAEEVSATSGMDGMGMLTFTGAETDCSTLAANFKAASGPKATLMTLYPRVLAEIGTGTLSAGSAGGGTLGTVLLYDVTGCFVRTTGGTGGGGTGGANNQARKIATYNTSTGAFTVVPNWETTPSTDTTYVLLLPEGVTLGMLKALNPSTAGRTVGIESNGKVTGVVLTDTVTTYTGNTPQTGDGYPILSSGTHGNAALKTLVDDIPTNAELATALAAADDAVLAAIAALNNLSQANIRTAIGLASANLDTQLDALPTNAELATSQAAADDATLAAIAALNNLSAAQVRTELATELARLDVAVSTRMASYTQPTGFLAATFPSDPADHSIVIAATDAIIAAISALNNLSQANVRSALGMASANLDTQLDALPTNAELATALAAADDATLAAIAALSIPTAVQNADALLDRDMSTGTDSGSATVRTVRQALRVLRNRVAIAAGTMTVYKENDSTASFTGAVTTAAGNPISEIDPASS